MRIRESRPEAIIGKYLDDDFVDSCKCPKCGHLEFIRCSAPGCDDDVEEECYALRRACKCTPPYCSPCHILK